MDADDHVRWTRHGRVGRITLNRPQRKNALTRPMWQALAQLVAERVAAEDVRVLVVDGACGTFCSGNDIEMLRAGLTDRASTHAFHALVDRALQAVRDVPVPTIAAVDGACFGAGLMLATACDLRVASTSARFCAPPAKLGLVYGIGETRSLVRLVGAARAKEMLFTARVVAGEEALRIGLVERSGEMPASEAALALAQEIAGLSSVTHLASKRMVEAAAVYMPHQAWMDELRDGSTGTADFQEGHAAFFAKRPPRFS